MPNIPAPLRAVLETFQVLAHNPALYLAHVKALDAAVGELACELGPCPSCGYDGPKQPANRYPLRVEVLRGVEYCAVCGETAIDTEPAVEPEPMGRGPAWNPNADWDSEYKAEHYGC
jgi:hypothetical protein